MFFAMLIAVLLILSTGAAVRFYLAARSNLSSNRPVNSPEQSESDNGPSNSLEAQNKYLRDQVDQLNARLQNALLAQKAPREIDKKNPALALFSPVVIDHTQDQNQVTIANIKLTRNKDKTANLTFELHNAHEGESTEKGYIVVLARSESGLLAYPNSFNTTGPYLMDFEKGETFQVARFRMVNAQFDGDAQDFQILIFTRNGVLLINQMYSSGGPAN